MNHNDIRVGCFRTAAVSWSVCFFLTPGDNIVMERNCSVSRRDGEGSLRLVLSW